MIIKLLNSIYLKKYTFKKKFYKKFIKNKEFNYFTLGKRIKINKQEIY